MPNIKKIVQVINFFASKFENKTISKIHLLKLIYLADRYHLRKYGRLITGDNYFAMQNGPVASLAKTIAECNTKSNIVECNFDYLKDYIGRKGADVSALKNTDLDEFSETNIEALNKAYDTYLEKDDIIDFTHKFPEWKKHESKLKIQKRVKINIIDFFEKADADVEYCIISEKLCKLSKEEYCEDHGLA